MTTAILSNKSLDELKADVTPFLLKSAAHTFELTLKTAKALYEIKVRGLYVHLASSFEKFVEDEWKALDHHVDVTSASNLADAGEAWYLLEAAGVHREDLPTSYTAARTLLLRATHLDIPVATIWEWLLQKHGNAGNVSVRKIKDSGGSHTFEFGSPAYIDCTSILTNSSLEKPGCTSTAAADSDGGVSAPEAPAGSAIGTGFQLLDLMTKTLISY